MTQQGHDHSSRKACHQNWFNIMCSQLQTIVSWIHRSVLRDSIIWRIDQRFRSTTAWRTEYFLSALPPLLGLPVLRGLRVSVWWGLEWISHIDLLNLKDLRGVDLTSPWDVRNRTSKYLRLPGCNVRCRFNTCHLVLVSHCWWVRCVEIVIIWRIDLRFRSTTAWRTEYY